MTDYDAILNDDSINCVVELMGGVTDAKDVSGWEGVCLVERVRLLRKGWQRCKIVVGVDASVLSLDGVVCKLDVAFLTRLENQERARKLEEAQSRNAKQSTPCYIICRGVKALCEDMKKKRAYRVMCDLLCEATTFHLVYRPEDERL